MPSSPIRKLVPYADAAKARGIEIFHLNIGQPDIETPHQFMEAVRASDIKVLEYSHSQGILSYRQKLAGYYGTFGIDVTPEQIIISTGGSEGIGFAWMSTLDPGDEVIIPEPFYANYNGFAVAAGVTIVPVPSDISTGFALPDAAAFESRITSKTKGIAICNPNNPTGYLYSREELEALGQLALKHDLFLYADEVYREMTYDGRKATSVLSLEGLEQHAIVLDSISKRYSACGARIGALVTKNQAVLDCAMKFAQARLSPPTLEQIGAEACVDVEASYFENVLAEYVERRDVMVARLNAMPGVQCPTPGGAFYAMTELPVDDAELFCVWLLESFSHEGATVMLAPAQGFYATPELGRKQVRLAYVLNPERLNRAMDCLEAALLAYPGRSEEESVHQETILATHA